MKTQLKEHRGLWEGAQEQVCRSHGGEAYGTYQLVILLGWAPQGGKEAVEAVVAPSSKEGGR